MLTHERLLQLLAYDPETGVFTWKERTANRVKVGDTAGSLHHDGYIVIRIDGGLYRAHRLAWFYVTGGWPSGHFFVDHKDLNRARNVWTNLRLATNKQNGENPSLSKRNKSGYQGVWWNEKAQAYDVKICHNRKQHYIGRYISIDEAVEARQKAEKELFTHSRVSGPEVRGALSPREERPYRTRQDSTTGHRGISFDKKRGMYRARYMNKGKTIDCGFHATIEAALLARLRSEALTGTLAKPDSVPSPHIPPQEFP